MGEERGGRGEGGGERGGYHMHKQLRILSAQTTIINIYKAKLSSYFRFHTFQSLITLLGFVVIQRYSLLIDVTVVSWERLSFDTLLATKYG